VDLQELDETLVAPISHRSEGRKGRDKSALTICLMVPGSPKKLTQISLMAVHRLNFTSVLCMQRYQRHGAYEPMTPHHPSVDFLSTRSLTLKMVTRCVSKRRHEVMTQRISSCVRPRKDMDSVRSTLPLCFGYWDSEYSRDAAWERY
jgi:hypothetical protein